MRTAHLYLGALAAGSFALLFGWGIYSWIRNRDPNQWFWRLLAIGQISLVVFAITGAYLLVVRGNQHWLHYAYGAFPFLILGVAHRWSARIEGLEWAAFSIAGLVIFGLLTRGLMTGLGL